MQRNIVTSLLLYESVRTTKKRAEVIRPLVDRLIHAAKTKEPHVAIRYINALVTHRNASRKTMEVFKQRYATRTSGFTRMTPLGSRQGDGAELVQLELIDANVQGEMPETAKKEPRVKKEPKTKKAAAPKAEKKAEKKSSPASEK